MWSLRLNRSIDAVTDGLHVLDFSYTEVHLKVHRSRTRSGTRQLPVALALALVATTASLATAQATKPAATSSAAGPVLTPELQKVRAALDKYQDPVLAVHDGYLSTLGCVAYPKGGGEGTMKYVAGGMGVHFINGQLIGPNLDPAKPQVLIYEMDGDKLKLAAAEWFVPVEAAGKAAPKIFGQQLGGPMAGHKPVMPDGLVHYDLHVWLWKNNPAGVYSPTNPAVTCPKGAYSFSEDAPKMVMPKGKGMK